MQDTNRLDRSRLSAATAKSPQARAKANRRPHPRMGRIKGDAEDVTLRDYLPSASPSQHQTAHGNAMTGWDVLPHKMEAKRIVRRKRITQAYGRSALVGGLVGSTISIVLAWFICGYSGMWARRSEITVEMASQQQQLSDQWNGNLPPVSWSILCDDEHLATRAAVISDIQNMTDPDAGFGLFSWPSLPYMIGTGHMSDCDELIKIVDGIYGDYPELSVYTDGQCIQAVAAVARYMLPAASGVSSEDNQSEYDEVCRRLDEIADECEEASDGSDFSYIREAYRHIAENCVYSSDDAESPHANDIYGAVIEGESRCYGGAAALKALLDRRGIPSFMASGVVHGDPSQRHAWNLVWLDGEWYACDLTCSMGNSPDDNDGLFYSACLTPATKYNETQDILMDTEDKELMSAYESLISDGAYDEATKKATE